jgi:D-glycero-D-manno-heptose 1,7-bisphosphate phosphatase
METQRIPTVFLDRDGTINEEMGYINHPNRFRLLPGVADAIRRLNEAGVLVVVVTNQSGVARGYFHESLVTTIHQKLEELIAQKGAHIDRIYYCPHHPSAGPPEYRKECSCRKPAPGMIEQAVADLPIDLTRSYCVGDRIKDIYFGHTNGLQSLLVLTGYGRGEYEFQRDTWKEQPDFIADNLSEAVDWILKDLERKDDM